MLYHCRRDISIAFGVSFTVSRCFNVSNLMLSSWRSFFVKGFSLYYVCATNRPISVQEHLLSYVFRRPHDPPWSAIHRLPLRQLQRRLEEFHRRGVISGTFTKMFSYYSEVYERFRSPGNSYLPLVDRLCTPSYAAKPLPQTNSRTIRHAAD